MNIAIVGLGYVGTVSAACLADRGHRVWGVDINAHKVRLINEGRSPIVEEYLPERIGAGVQAGRLFATSNIEQALSQTEICFLAVATPSRPNGQIDAAHLFRASEQIAGALARLGKKQTVVIRSSLLPAAYERCRSIFSTLAPDLADVCVNPEFLREGTAIRDFEQPPFTILGVNNDSAERRLRALYADIPAPIFALNPAEALMIKYASNCYHALKVAFANEIAAICRHSGADAGEVLKVFCQDTKLNISPRYLMPGFAFGGSCLPKDVRALLHTAREHDLRAPLVGAILESNDAVIGRALDCIRAMKPARIGLIGLSFKANTDDLRESPYVELAERLIGKGFELKIYDPNVLVTRLTGANKEYIDRVIPHLSRLLVDRPGELSDSDLLVAAHRYDGLEILFRETRAHILDLSAGEASLTPAEPEPVSV